LNCLSDKRIADVERHSEVNRGSCPGATGLLVEGGTPGLALFLIFQAASGPLFEFLIAAHQP
jgi:hypothetical protein